PLLLSRLTLRRPPTSPLFPYTTLFRSGLAPFAGPTAGYLISFPFAAGILGIFAGRAPRGIPPTAALVAGGLLAELVIYGAGAAGIMLYAGMNASGALAAAALYIPGDLIKLGVVVLIASAVHRAFPALLQPLAHE